jgi:hypothetical protein
LIRPWLEVMIGCGRDADAPGVTANKIFISYRHGLAGGHARDIDEAVAERFGRHNVYFDVHGLPGHNLVREIGEAVGRCAVLLVLIGPGWAEQRDGSGNRRLEDPHDFVRLELETGLARDDVVVLPLMVAGARALPARDQLPGGLRSLPDYRALELLDAHWDFYLGKLLAALEQLLPRRIPDAALLLGGIGLAGLVGVLARQLQDVLPEPRDQTSDAAAIAASMLGRAELWALVAAALALWLAFAHGEGGLGLALRGLTGLVVGALGAAVADAIVSVPSTVWDEPTGGYQVAAVGVVGATLGGLLGSLWRPPAFFLGLVSGTLAGIVGELLLRGAGKQWDQVAKVGTRAALITAVVLGALLAFDARREIRN